MRMIEKIIYMDHPNISITGGHKYNDAFEEYLQELSGTTIQNEPQLSGLYHGWRHLFSPFFEIRRLRRLNKNSIVFWGDDKVKYHLLLICLSKFVRRTRNVFIIHHFPYLGYLGIKQIFWKAILKMYYSFGDYIVVPSPFTLDVAKKFLPNKKIVYVPLPFERIYSPSKNFEKGNLLYVGTVEPRKGLIYLLEAMHLFSLRSDMHLKLNVIGKVVDEQYKKELDYYVKIYSLDVRFWGRVTNEQLDDCYKNAEVFTFPSLLEGFGIVLVEAMQRGLPIVCFDNTAMPYSIIDGYNGYLAKNKDADDFCNKLLKICGCIDNRECIQNGIKESISKMKNIDDFRAGVKSFFEILENEE